MSSHSGPRVPRPPLAVLKAFGLHILVPLFLCAGMALAYLGAFHEPAPHHLKVAVVGASLQAGVLAQALNDSAPEELDVRTVPDTASAKRLISERTISVAYEAGSEATLFVSTAVSGTTATIAQKIFLPIAYQEHLPLKVEDVVPAGKHDPSGQGLFFLLVALSIGGYASAIAIAAVAGRLHVLWQLALAAVTSAVVAGIGVIVAGPIYQVIDHALWATWLMAWLYCAAIMFIGVGLHPVLRQWTTPILTLLFVMLNFTSSGGIYTADFVPPFFAALGSFWNGAAWIHAVQTVTYFPGQEYWSDLVTLGVWAAGGVLLVFLTHWWSIRGSRVADEQVPVREEEEVIAA